jgi:hypothetical protein
MTSLHRRVAVLATLLAGCSTTIRVKEITGRAEGGSIDGIPFRVKQPYTLRVFARQQNGTYRQVLVQAVDLADPDRLYAVNFDASTWGNRSFEAKLRDDATLESVHIKSEDKTGEVLAAAGKQANAVTDAAVSFESKRREAEIAGLKSQLDLAKAKAELPAYAESQQVDRETKVLAALEARNAADTAERAIADLPPDATSSQRAAAEEALRVARLKANQAARRAGLGEPYPEVSP